MLPIVSIIIPYYNKKDTILRSVNSVIAQTYTNWELIIIDDCGEDRIDLNTLPKDDRISVLFNESNRGAAQTRQRGLEIAKGEYIAFLDADDWWDEKFLNSCLNFLEKEESADGAYTTSNIMVNNEYMGNRRYFDLGLTKICETIIQYSRPWQTGSILWRKESTGNWGKLKTHEDAWFEISSASFNKLIFINSQLHYFDKTNPNTLSTYYDSCGTHKNQQLLYIEIYKKCFHKISIKFKLILINRLIRGHLKIIEYCGCEEGKVFRRKINKESVMIASLFRFKVLMSLVNKIFQRSRYRINF
jgi:glycosyltransferase involved in cell wall biosynthesis